MARTLDMDRTHTTRPAQAAHEHKGAAFIEIYQNCNVFNDKAFIQLTGKEERVHNRIDLEHGKPIVFGPGWSQGRGDGEGGQAMIVDHQRRRRPAILVHDRPDPIRRSPSPSAGCPTGRTGRRRSASSAM